MEEIEKICNELLLIELPYLENLDNDLVVEWIFKDNKAIANICTYNHYKETYELSFWEVLNYILKKINK